MRLLTGVASHTVWVWAAQLASTLHPARIDQVGVTWMTDVVASGEDVEAVLLG